MRVRAKLTLRNDVEEMKAAILDAMGTLTFREREILSLRFGIRDGEEHTLEEVGLIFRIQRERVRQIQNRAIRKMQHPANAYRIRRAAAGVEDRDGEA